MLYMGYVGFSVAFAFAVAALLGGRLDAAWARWSRPWTTAAWCFLTLGIALGSAWAYYELGWGGWWFWDPVENASLMPWLAGTALIHSLAATEKRGAFRSWTVLLAIGTFSLSLLGAFLVRSGVLTSVHTFATDPQRGLFMLGFFTLVTGGSLALYAWRVPRIGAGGGFEPASRESLLLANNVLLIAAAATVLLGTLYPLAMDAFDLGRISVGPQYFDVVLLPILAPLVFLMAVGPATRWRHTRLAELAVRLRWALAASALAAAAAAAAMGELRPLAGFGLFLAFWVVAASALGLRGKLAARPRAYYGMLTAHCGVAACVAGITLVGAYSAQSDVRMASGDTARLGDYSFRFDGVRQVTGPNYRGVRGSLEVQRGARSVATLQPEKRRYQSQEMPMTEAAIATGLRGDVYVSLGEALGDGTWTLRLQVKPFVTWIWGGCLLMALGGLLALTDRRYRMAGAANGAILCEPPGQARAGRRKMRAAALAATVLALCAAVLYSHFGRPDLLLAQRAAAGGPATPAQLEALAGRLAARLERQPQDAQGWRVLALSYYAMQRFPDAARAYGRLAEIVPDDPSVLADHADALAMAQGRRMAGQPLALARRALELDPAQWKARALMATEAFQRKDYQAAIGHWQALQVSAPPDSEMAKTVAGYIAQARRLASGSGNGAKN
jgi:cytochrome c-type biogenesis protein CcmF